MGQEVKGKRGRFRSRVKGRVLTWAALALWNVPGAEEGMLVLLYFCPLRFGSRQVPSWALNSASTTFIIIIIIIYENLGYAINP